MGVKLEYDEEYYTYLDELRRSGILRDWQDTFSDRSEAGETGD